MKRSLLFSLLNIFKALCPTTDKLEQCGEYLCGFWDEEKAVWLKSGCTLTSMTEILIECQCNHLTNFATLFVSEFFLFCFYKLLRS